MRNSSDIHIDREDGSAQHTRWKSKDFAEICTPMRGTHLLHTSSTYTPEISSWSTSFPVFAHGDRCSLHHHHAEKALVKIQVPLCYVPSGATNAVGIDTEAFGCRSSKFVKRIEEKEQFGKGKDTWYVLRQSTQRDLCAKMIKRHKLAEVNWMQYASRELQPRLINSKNILRFEPLLPRIGRYVRLSLGHSQDPEPAMRLKHIPPLLALSGTRIIVDVTLWRPMVALISRLLLERICQTSTPALNDLTRHPSADVSQWEEPN